MMERKRRCASRGDCFSNPPSSSYQYRTIKLSTRRLAAICSSCPRRPGQSIAMQTAGSVRDLQHDQAMAAEIVASQLYWYHSGTQQSVWEKVRLWDYLALPYNSQANACLLRHESAILSILSLLNYVHQKSWLSRSAAGSDTSREQGRTS